MRRSEGIRKSDLRKRKGTAMFELVEVRTGRIIERYDYDFDEFIKTKYGGFFSLITDDTFIPGDVRPEFAWRRSKITELVNAS